MNSKIIFIIAFLAVITGIYGVFDTFFQEPQKQDTVFAPAPKPDVKYITLWRSKGNTEKGKPLSIDQVNREQMILDEALKLGIKEDINLDFTATTLLNSDIQQGELVFPEHQTKQDQPGYIDLLIEEGMTLYPLQVTSKNLIKHFINPGDYIDIMTVSSPLSNLSEPEQQLNQFDGVKASLFMQRVKVMNIGDDKQTNNSVKAKVNTETAGFTTVVIEVPPEQLARLSLAQRTMHIEIYRSHHYDQPLKAEVRDVIDNYTGITEMRGSETGHGDVF